MDDTAPWQPPGPVAVGSVLGNRYRLEAVIGRGGMADVYRADDTVLARPVAVKVFRPGSALPDGEARQDAEVRLLAGLNHTGLVTVYDAGGDDRNGQSYLVMELVGGPTLAQRLATSGRLSEAEVRSLAVQLAAALEYIHVRGVVHRDVKPPNILYTDPDAARPGVPPPTGGWSVKLTDFGIAKMTEATRLTMMGQTIGTANYLSPEQALGRDVGPASDVYSLGLVLIEAVTGVIPFAGSGVEVAGARLHRQPDVPGWLSPAMRSVLTAMTARHAEHRPDAAEVVAAFRGDAAALARTQALVAAAAGGTAGTQALGYARPTERTQFITPDVEDARGTTTMPPAGPPTGSVSPTGPGAAVPPAGTADRPRNRSAVTAAVAVGVAIVAIVIAGIVIYTQLRGSGSGSGSTTPSTSASASPSSTSASATPSSSASSASPSSSSATPSASSTSASPTTTAPTTTTPTSSTPTTTAPVTSSAPASSTAPATSSAAAAGATTSTPATSSTSPSAPAGAVSDSTAGAG